MVLAGHPDTPYFAMAHDMAAALGASGNLRLVPVDAPGGTESLRDLLMLRGIDLALIPANVLADAGAGGTFAPEQRQKLAYVTELYGQEVHILVGAAVTSLEALRGKKIAVPPGDGNAEFTIRDLLHRLDVEADIVSMAPADAIDDVKSGELAALALLGGKPMGFVAGLPQDGSIRLLALPLVSSLENSYSPSAFRSEDYPTLVPNGQTIDTVSVSAVLMANTSSQWDDPGRRLAKFVPEFFAALSELSSPQRHPKWTEVNVAATLDGWPRLAVAEQWIAKAKQEQAASLQKTFEQFLKVRRGSGAPALQPAEQKRLFEDFVKWTRQSVQDPDQAAPP